MVPGDDAVPRDDWDEVEQLFCQPHRASSCNGVDVDRGLFQEGCGVAGDTIEVRVEVPWSAHDDLYCFPIYVTAWDVMQAVSDETNVPLDCFYLAYKSSKIRPHFNFGDCQRSRRT